MKKANSQRFANTKNRWQRRLGLEPLEDRTLLAAWGGFDAVPTVSEYVSAAKVQLQADADEIMLANVDSDNAQDLIAVHFANGNEGDVSSITVYFNDGNGDYSVRQSITTNLLYADEANILPNSTDGFDVVLGDVTNDGLVDLIVVRQETENSSNLVVRIFAGTSDGRFVENTELQSTLSLTKFGEYTYFTQPTLEMALVGGDLLIQAKSIYGRNAGGSLVPVDGAVLYKFKDTTFSNDGAQKFDNFNGTLYGSVTLNNVNYSVAYGNGYIYLRTASNGNEYSFQYTTKEGLSKIGVDWMIASGDKIYFAGENTTPTSDSLVVAQLEITESVLGFFDYKVYAVEGVEYTSSSCAALGDMNISDGYVNLLTVTGKTSKTLKAVPVTTGVPQYSLVEEADEPDYVAVYAVTEANYGCDGYLAVGSGGIWFIPGDNLSAAPEFLKAVHRTVRQVSFGYFAGENGESGENDALVDIAVQYDTGIDVYVQTSIENENEHSFDRAKIIVFSDVAPSSVLMTVGKFTHDGSGGAKANDEILVYIDRGSDSNGPRLLVYDLTKSSGNECVQTISLNAEITALTSGKLFGGVFDDVVYSVGSSVYVRKNTSGALYVTNNTNVTSISVLPADGEALNYKPTSLTIGDVTGDNKADIVFLNAGSGAKGTASIGWIEQVNDLFTAAGVHYSGAFDAVGTFGSVLLADLSGDGLLDAVTTVTSDGKSKIYAAINRGDASGVFGTPSYCELAGNFNGGVEFGVSSIVSPGLVSVQIDNDTNGFYDLVLIKGRSVVFLCSAEKAASDRDVYYIVRSVKSEASTTALTDEEIAGQDDVYTWIDEWSRYCVEIWGEPGADGTISFFTASFSWDPAYYVCDQAFGGTDFTLSGVDASTVGQVTISGYASNDAGEVSVGDVQGGKILLARVFMAPYGSGGINLEMLIEDDDYEQYEFRAFDSQITVEASGQSINRSDSCENVTFNKPDLYPVRYDFNDDGRFDGDDYTPFSLSYGAPQISAERSKSKVFDAANKDGKLDGDDYTLFANGYGFTLMSVKTRFYDDARLNPTDWGQAGAQLPASVDAEAPQITLYGASAETVPPEIVLDEEIVEEALLPLTDLSAKTLEIEELIAPLAETRAAQALERSERLEEIVYQDENVDDGEFFIPKAASTSTKINTDLTTL